MRSVAKQSFPSMGKVDRGAASRRKGWQRPHQTGDRLRLHPLRPDALRQPTSPIEGEDIQFYSGETHGSR